MTHLELINRVAQETDTGVTFNFGWENGRACLIAYAGDFHDIPLGSLPSKQAIFIAKKYGYKMFDIPEKVYDDLIKAIKQWKLLCLTTTKPRFTAIEKDYDNL